SQSASPGELRTRLLDVLGTLWLARGQDVRTDATFQLLRALVLSPLGLFDQPRGQQGTSRQAMKAMAKSAHERDRVIAELKRDREHDRPRIQHLEAETMKL